MKAPSTRDYTKLLDYLTHRVCHASVLSADWLCLRAQVYAIIGEFPKAIQDYTEAIKQRPLFVRAYSSRAYAHELMREFGLAIDDYTQAIKLEPGNADHYCSRATVFLRMRRPSRALADLERAISVNTKHAPAHLLMGDVFFYYQSKWEEAYAEYSEYQRLEGRPGFVGYELGLISFLRRQWLGARAHFQTCIDARGYNAQPRILALRALSEFLVSEVSTAQALAREISNKTQGARQDPILRFLQGEASLRQTWAALILEQA